MAHRHTLVEPRDRLTRIVSRPSGVCLKLLLEERILDGTWRLSYDCPQSCRNGNCHIYAALLVEGRVHQNDEIHDHGRLFTCLAEPLESYVLHQDGMLTPGKPPLHKLTCQLSFREEVDSDVYRVDLRASAGKSPRHHAGQCLLLERDGGDNATFSLASAPHAGRDLELHILAREGSAVTLIVQLQRERLARIQLPLGDAHLAKLSDGPLVLIAAGTGVSQIHSLIEHCHAIDFAHPVHLYRGVRRPEGFYRLPHWTKWEGLPNLFLHRVVSDPCGWEGCCGLLHEAMREDFADLSSLHVYVNDSPTMVYAALDTLVEAGMDTHWVHADVFVYAPRD